MPGAPHSRWSCQRLRLGTLAAFLLALGGLAFLGGVATRAGTPPFSPQVAAFFPSNDKLVVAVADAGDKALRVELIGADGKLIAAADQKAAAGAARFELAANKAAADGLTLRCRVGAQRKDLPLARV